MRFLRNIMAVLLALWVIFVTTGTTVYQHVCRHTGDVQISINTPVECEHTRKTEEKDHCCKHHCSKEVPSETTEGCCDKSQITFYVDIKKQETAQEHIPLSLTAFPFTLLNKDGNDYGHKVIECRSLGAPPDPDVSSIDLLLLKESFLI